MKKQITFTLLVLLVGGIFSARGQTIIDVIASGGSNTTVTIGGVSYDVNSTIGQPVIDEAVPNDNYTVGFNQGFTCQYVWDSIWVQNINGWYDLVPNTDSVYMQIKSGWCFTGVEEKGDKSVFDVNLYPNPAIDQVMLKLTNIKTNEFITWDLVDINGKIIKSEKLKNPESSIPLVGISQGVYFLKVESNLYSKSFKLIKN